MLTKQEIVGNRSNRLVFSSFAKQLTNEAVQTDNGKREVFAAMRNRNKMKKADGFDTANFQSEPSYNISFFPNTIEYYCPKRFNKRIEKKNKTGNFSLNR